MAMMGSGGLDTTALLAQRLQQLEADERRAVQRSRWMMLVACLLGELALILSLGAALWSKQYAVFPASISDLNADNDNPNSKIFFGLLVAMGITLLASKYGQRILRLHTLPEMVYFDVIIPVAIIVTASVPEIMPPDEDGGGGAWIMTAVHSGAAVVVCVVSPIILMIKSIPRLPPQSRGCATSLCQPNPVLASHGDVLLRCGGRPLLRYHWGQMVVIQTVCVGLFVIFFAYNELYAAEPLLHEHVISFASEFTLVTFLFFSFLIITRLGLEEEGGSVAHGTGASAGSIGRGSGDRVAVTVRDSNGGGRSAAARDEEEEAVQQGGGDSGPQAERAHNGHGTQEQPSQTGNGFAEWVRQFTNRVSIGE